LFEFENIWDLNLNRGFKFNSAAKVFQKHSYFLSSPNFPLAQLLWQPIFSFVLNFLTWPNQGPVHHRPNSLRRPTPAWSSPSSAAPLLLPARAGHRALASLPSMPRECETSRCLIPYSFPHQSVPAPSSLKL
jgi:hypothetical protein